MSATNIIIKPSVQHFQTSESQHVMEQRNWHVFATELMVSKGSMKKLADLEKSVLLDFFKAGRDEDSMTSMKVMM